MNIANIWIAVFVFAKKVTFVLSDWLFLAFISLKAATQTSLEIISADHLDEAAEKIVKAVKGN